MSSELKEDDVVLCTVRKIEGTTVFLDIEGNGQGSMTMSEVAAGRIRNIRDYVFPNKKIVCKVLKITRDHIELSLRRVTGGEREDVLDRSKKERALVSMLKSVGADAVKIIEEIKKKYDVADFVSQGITNNKIFEDLLGKEKTKKFLEIVSEKGEKEKTALGKIILRSESGRGVSEIKEILDLAEVELKYLGSSVFSVSVKGKDFKEANANLANTLDEIEKRAKKLKVFFEVKEK